MKEKNPLQLNGNPEHDGISIAIALAFLGIVFVAMVIIMNISSWLWGGGATQYALLSCFAGLIVAAVGILILDPYIKQWLPSGVILTLDDNQISLEQPDEETLILTHPLAEPPLYWRIQMKGAGHNGRERQIRNGWFCYACQLQNEDDKIVVHTFIPPKEIVEMDEAQSFAPLDLKELNDKSETRRISRFRTYGTLPAIPTTLIVSDHGRYWLGERHRWEHGIELAPEDFRQVLHHLKDL